MSRVFAAATALFAAAHAESIVPPTPLEKLKAMLPNEVVVSA